MIIPLLEPFASQPKDEQASYTVTIAAVVVHSTSSVYKLSTIEVEWEPYTALALPARQVDNLLCLEQRTLPPCDASTNPVCSRHRL